jgi:hypothetical protein
MSHAAAFEQALRMFDFDDMKPRYRFPRWLRFRLPLWLVLALVLLVGALVAAQQTGFGTAKRDSSAGRETLAGELQARQASMEANYLEALRRRTEESDILFGTALAWAVRSAMLRKNLDEIDQYVTALMKNPRIQLVLVADRSGKVLLSSDRRLQGSRLSAHVPSPLLNATEVTVEPPDAQGRHLVLPIQGLTTRLGTVVVRFAAL